MFAWLVRVVTIYRHLGARWTLSWTVRKLAACAVRRASSVRDSHAGDEAGFVPALGKRVYVKRQWTGSWSYLGGHRLARRLASAPVAV